MTEHTGDALCKIMSSSSAIFIKLGSQGFLDSFTEEEAVVQEGSSIVYHSDGNMLARYLEELSLFRNS